MISDFIIVLVLTAAYVVLCLVSPLGLCRRCDGTGDAQVGFFRPCRRCHGSGLRARLGLRLLESVRRRETK